MSSNRGFNVETVKRLNTIGVLTKLFGMKAYAEEADEADKGGDTTTTPAPAFDFEKMIAQARKEEKEKLYPRLKKLEDENKAITASNNANLLEVARLKDELETAKKNAGSVEDSQRVKDLVKKVAELEDELKSTKESMPDEKAIEAKYKAEYELKSYIADEVAKNKDNILPTLAKKISGKTKEEVDSAIQSAIDETLENKKALGLVDEDGKPVVVKKQKQEKPPVANPSGSKDKEYDLDYIRNLDPRSKEYQEYRKSVGLK